jgi:hypothetical protein
LVATLRASRSATKPANDRSRRAGGADPDRSVRPQDGANPREQLARIERLAEIVVGAELQPDDAVDVFALGLSMMMGTALRARRRRQIDRPSSPGSMT